MSRRFATCCALALFATVVIGPYTVCAQTATISDTLAESIKDLNPTSIATLPVTAPILLPEIPGEATDKTITYVGHEIDFREPLGSNVQFSDRLSISPYTVRILSDDNPNGLPPRTEPDVMRIPPSALETFSPYVITARSDGDLPTSANVGSDRLTILRGVFGSGTGDTIFDGIVPEPTPEGVTEPVLDFDIPALRFDVIEPPGEVAGAQGIISDYVDVSRIHVRFISSDDPAIIANLPIAEGFVVENVETGGGVRVSLEFRSDTNVPEPSTLLLLGLGGFALVSANRRRK